ncbi:MAG: fibronectin type III domain-containing protein [Acidobacteriota bacterium]|nr:fibronectin type III domain-containing protein [Acidobacteriota bacterium]
MFFIAAATLSFFNYGCGKRRPPVPPATNLRFNQNGFTVVQQGNRIALSIPLRNNATDGPRRIDVFRLAESVNSPQFLTEEEFASRSTQVGSIQLPDTRTENEVVFFDVITPTAQPRRLRYAIRFVNRENQRSGFSNFVFFEPISNAAKPPLLGEPIVSQTSINLRWEAPTENLDESEPVNVIGYNVYRKSKNADKPSRLNSSLLPSSDFEDKNFKFGENYEYFVRAVSAGANGVPVESNDSNITKITPLDLFPPSPPVGLTIAAAPGNLSIFFAANSEPDVIGYNIFRTTMPETPREKWQKLNETPFAATSYQDTKIESGQRYYYYVTAVDSAGNASKPSEIVSESVP